MQPLYQKVKDYITSQIAAGQWGQGERVPSENELVRRLGVSRMTVNRALRELTEHGVLSRTAGVGTFVAEARQRRPAMPLRDIAEDLAQSGQSHSARVLEHCSCQPDDALAAVFERSRGASLFHSLVLHQGDGTPVMLEDRWVSPAVAPGYLDIDLATATATRYLLTEAPVQRVEQTVEAIAAGPEAARHLAVEPESPLLLIRRRTWARDQVASYAQLYFAGGRYRLIEWADELPRVPARFE